MKRITRVGVEQIGTINNDAFYEHLYRDHDTKIQRYMLIVATQSFDGLW